MEIILTILVYVSMGKINKMKRKIKMTNIFTIVVIVATIVVGVIHRKDKQRYHEELKGSADYYIGEVIKFTSATSSLAAPKFANRGRNAEIEFFFVSNDKKLVCKYDDWTGYIPSRNVIEGDKFLVLHPKGTLSSESRILLDYPIKDSIDFKRYVKEFEQMRKQKAQE